MRNVIERLTEDHVFTAGIEGPACDRDGNVYAVNYGRNGTIGRVAPDGRGEVWLELPNGSIGNGIRFDREGHMYIADYVHHNIFKVDAGTKKLSVFAHEPRMNQPNDIAISENGTIYASDPNWDKANGNLWRIDREGNVALLESDMGTTNGIEVGPGDKTLYVNESVQKTVWVYDLDPIGNISGKRLLIRFEDYSLDGMRCDIEGNLYVTRFGKGVIAKVSPQGELLDEIPLLGKDCTNICFGGPDGRTAYTTLSDQGNIQAFRVETPGRCWSLWGENG